MTGNKWGRTLAMSVAAWFAVTSAAHAAVDGAGASFPSKVYQKWAETFEKRTGVPVRYKPTGSGDGVKQITARAVQFGGSDSPLTADELQKRKLVQVPMLVGGIVPVVNLPGVANQRLQLTGEVLAAIMAGQVTQWNDPRITSLNAGLTLPSTAIKRVVRGDKSGTTDGFTRYLAKAMPSFERDVGVGQSPNWPGTVDKADGNDGMVKALKAAPGTIAYVSYDRAERDNLVTVKLRNAAGNWVAASEAGFRAAIQESDVARKGDDVASIMDRPGVTAWPITMTSFVLFDASPAKGDDALPALRFLYWCFMHGDDLTRGTGFAPLPVILQARLAARFAVVKAQDGKVLDYVSK
ncbi:phosphate ABC transporter substrate-binding protein PstS [Piscinibacter gummiphilus]|uniref:Phosphate-binding protein PstS n=1 Tax=Piscinibacter gummiphilus TaxID=946333 RepID=A0A1W6L2H1_9BURK|nr:phosphate ABC transporter substrate-binding protein PstS [Piscinibacter gummiphilus]ARN18454.1 hypothetical protein A4W93_00155 [Piscinibacter gummiphilus]ATU63083.1 phosphate ABC transporter substrate-binding protein PstS [Piscinibacter gummiphilus]GLS95391.1 phosphate-binding protein [Piscinibacter gummiphilus]